MFFRLGLEEFQNLIGYFVVRGQGVKVRSRRRCNNGLLGRYDGLLLIGLCLGIIQWRRFRREREAITFFESCDIVEALFACVANFEQIRLKKRNAV